MAGRHIFQVSEEYKKARISYVTSIAELAARSQNVEYLEQYDVVNLLHPLLGDTMPSIQHMAAVALGRLANVSEKSAGEIIEKDILADLLRSLEKQNKCYKKAAIFALRAISKHSARHAAGVVQGGGLQAMVKGLEDFELELKEAAAWAIGYVARHNEELAKHVVEAGVLPLLLSCINEKRLSLKQIGAAALCDISKHSFLLAQSVVDAGIVRAIVRCLENPDIKFKRQILATIGNVAKHSTDLAEHVIETNVLNGIFKHMAHPDTGVQKNAANVIREISRHSAELSMIIVNSGGIGALLDLMCHSASDSRVPAILALGFLSIYSECSALTIIKCKGLKILSSILHSNADNHTLAASIWTLGNIGRHSPEHANALANEVILKRLVELYDRIKSTNDIRVKCKDTLKMTLQQCTMLEALEPLLHDIPAKILVYVLRQFSKILPLDLKARCQFVTSGCLMRIQQIPKDSNIKFREYLSIINCCFPEDIVRYYSPGYPEDFVKRMESYSPQIPCVYGIEKWLPERNTTDINLDSTEITEED